MKSDFWIFLVLLESSFFSLSFSGESKADANFKPGTGLVTRAETVKEMLHWHSTFHGHQVGHQSLVLDHLDWFRSQHAPQEDLLAHVNMQRNVRYINENPSTISSQSQTDPRSYTNQDSEDGQYCQTLSPSKYSHPFSWRKTSKLALSSNHFWWNRAFVWFPEQVFKIFYRWCTVHTVQIGLVRPMWPFHIWWHGLTSYLLRDNENQNVTEICRRYAGSGSQWPQHKQYFRTE